MYDLVVSVQIGHEEESCFDLFSYLLFDWGQRLATRVVESETFILSEEEIGGPVGQNVNILTGNKKFLQAALPSSYNKLSILFLDINLSAILHLLRVLTLVMRMRTKVYR